MPQVLGFDVSVEVEGAKLPEYKPEVLHDAVLGVPVTTCWIPSEAGKEFCVAINPPPAPRDTHWSFMMKLDGTPTTVLGQGLFKDVATVRRLEEQIVAKGVARPFQFATIQLTDDDSALHGGVSPDLGSIALLMHSVDQYVPSAPKTDFGVVEPAGPVHEKAKKAFAHRIGFGEKRQFNDSTWWIPVGKKLQAIVVFKYRNIDILIADDIAPGRKPPIGTRASPPPVANAAGPSNPKKRKAKGPAVKIEIDMDDEEKELEARLAALRAKKRKTSGTVRAKDEVKPRLPPSFIPGEVIDLTED